uniref:ABC transporter G family member 16 n=1 Tax=Aegilops tauschii TaxID=37682 RepID=M8C510_AEGTA
MEVGAGAAPHPDTLPRSGDNSGVTTLDQLLSLRSGGSVSTATSEVDPSGHVVVDVQPTADDNDDGSTTVDDLICRPAVHFLLAFDDLTYSVKRPTRPFNRSRDPSYRILGLLDRLLFLSRGKTVYYGPPAALPPFFSEFGHPIPDGENPAEFALDRIRELEGTQAGTNDLVQFIKSWQEKPLSRASILATIFWRLDNTPKGVNERFGFFAIAMSTMFYTIADALPVFLIERYIFLPETAHNAYRRSSYTLSNAIVAFPPLVVLSLAFTGITFFAVGLAGGAEGFVFFALIVLASFWAGSGFVTFLSGVVPHVIIGYTVVVAVLAYFLLFSGFFVTRDRIPGYWIWFHYLSLIKYPYEAVMQNEFGADPGKCFMRGVQMFDGTPMGKLPVATQVTVLNAMSKSMRIDFNSNSCITTGTDILAKQAVDQLGKWGCLWTTLAWGFLFRILFYVTLLLGSRNKRS